jgi:hypothetical protein
MSSNRPKKELIGPWRSLHAVIWLVGLYILFTRGSFFPGILVLMAISAIYEGILQRFLPNAYEEQTTAEPESSQTMQPGPAPDMAPPVSLEHRMDLLPQVCPSCNGPIRGHEVKWTGPQAADCPYCGTNLPMIKA